MKVKLLLLLVFCVFTYCNFLVAQSSRLTQNGVLKETIIEEKTQLAGSILQLTLNKKTKRKYSSLQYKLLRYAPSINCCQLPDCKKECEDAALDCAKEEDREKCCDQCDTPGAISIDLPKVREAVLVPGYYQVSLMGKKDTLIDRFFIEKTGVEYLYIVKK